MARAPATPSKHKLLDFFQRWKGIWLTPEFITKRLWGRDDDRSRASLRAMICRLRDERPDVTIESRTYRRHYHQAGYRYLPTPRKPAVSKTMIRKDARSPENEITHYCRICPETFETTKTEPAHRSALIHHIFEHDRDRQYKRCSRDCELRAQPEELDAGRRMYGLGVPPPPPSGKSVAETNALFFGSDDD